MIRKIHDLWRTWRCFLRFALFDDLLVTAVLIALPLLAVWHLSHPTTAVAQAAPIATPVPMTWHYEPNSKLMVLKRPGPTH